MGVKGGVKVYQWGGVKLYQQPYQHPRYSPAWPRSPSCYQPRLSLEGDEGRQLL